MNYTEQIIKKMIEGGYREGITSWKYCTVDSEGFYATADPNTRIKKEFIFLDPEAWRALGKAMGWVDGDFVDYGDGHSLWSDAWQHQWHVFIDHLAEGGTIESYCKELIESSL